jgi:hypothetical protein
MKVNGTLQIKAIEKPGFSGGSYEWKTSSSKVTLQNEKSSTVTVKAKDKPGSGKESETITVTRSAAGCPDIKKEVKITVAKVTFGESAKQKYGYDDYDTPADTSDDHVSVKQSDTSFVKVKIEGGAVGTDFDWVCEPPAPCTPGAPEGSAAFDLELTAGADKRKETTLHARSKCPSKESFAQIKVNVYKERVVQVVVAKLDKTARGPNMRYPTADYASHQDKANKKLKEAVVKYEITNFDAANAVTAIDLKSGTSTVSYEIGMAGGGADLDAIRAKMSGTGTKVRVAVVRDIKSYYYLKNEAKKDDTKITVTSGHVFETKTTLTLGTGGSAEPVNIKSVSGSEITLVAPLTKDHPAGASLEYGVAGWGTNPILIKEGTDLETVKWNIVHEVGHRPEGLSLTDIDDRDDVMHYDEPYNDYRLRYCPRKIYRGGGTENQWETIPRD